MVGKKFGRVVLGTAALSVTALGATTLLGAGQANAWPWDDAAEKVGETIEDAAVGMVTRLVNAILWALIGLMEKVMSFFTAEKTNMDADKFDQMVSWAGDYTYQLQTIFLFFSIIIVAGRLAVAQWMGGSQAAVTNGMLLSVRTMATSLGAATLVILLTRASDIFATWIYGDTGEKVSTVTDQLQEQIGTIDSDNFDGSSLLLVIIALIAILGCLDLLIQLFLRFFYLAFGTAILPLAAASSGSEGGQGTYSQIIKLLIAMIAFKPICAGAFALAMAYPLSDESDANDIFINVLLYISPILCLPTLLSLVGVGGSIHGRVSGMAGVAALMVGSKGASRLGGRATGGAKAGVAALGSRAGAGGGGGSKGGPPTGTKPVSPSPRPQGGGGGGGTPRPAVAAGSASGGAGTPRSPQASSGQGAPSVRGESPATPRHATAGGNGRTPAGGGPTTTHSNTAGANPGRQSANEPPRANPRTDTGAAQPRHGGPTTAPPRPTTVGDHRATSGDRRTTARSIARRNLGSNYIPRR